jgi:hypothetical protein
MGVLDFIHFRIVRSRDLKSGFLKEKLKLIACTFSPRKLSHPARGASINGGYFGFMMQS